MIMCVLLHQGIGLDAFNELPRRKAVHALYECCNSVTMAGDLERGRPYASRGALFATADAVLFALSEDSVDEIMQAYPGVGSRPGSAWSHAEQCSVWDPRPEVMDELRRAARTYADHFGFEYVMHVGSLSADCPTRGVIAAIADRMHNDTETERKVVRNEIAKLNRSRLERMLGPEGGYDNWA
jgi:2-oxo-4-hydroxy-4-carboxy-5-ureidoimidazoline decarboxylase